MLYSETDLLPIFEAFGHYECYDEKLTMEENLRVLFSYHTAWAEEDFRQRMVNINSWFYGKESFKLGNLQIETKGKHD
jgi:hypothetical protein